MVNTFKLVSLVLSGALPSVLGGNLHAINHCSFDMWCWGAKNDGSTSPEVRVAAHGGVYASPLPAKNDNVGSVVKCSMHSDFSQPFQMELAVQNGRSWFDLSAIDGDPFLKYERHGDVSGQRACSESPKTTVINALGSLSFDPAFIDSDFCVKYHQDQTSDRDYSNEGLGASFTKRQEDIVAKYNNTSEVKPFEADKYAVKESRRT
ncbi:hypothetical protein GGR53DRAFT_462442 [Hypoxylon sp. FL1150]|nr:hypothetical protein GGR53DRAFT_462442 [Hypoxylon sp. FL1150]